MPTTAQDSHPAGGSIGTVPRAAWVAVALLCVVTTGLAAALIMRSAPSPDAGTNLASSAVSGPGARPDAAAPVAGASGPTVLPDRGGRGVGGSATPAQASGDGSIAGSSAARCASCGVVESVHRVQQKGQGTGVGAVAGGLLGGVVGHQLGHGNGNAAMTVIGAIGGGLAGNEVERRVRADTHFDVRVRMGDGSVRVYQRAQPLAIGTHVVADGATLRVSPDPAANDALHTRRTSVAPGSRT